MVREWLEELLPPDAAQRCSGRVYIVATHLPSLEPHVFGGDFADRASLIDALCASVHVPWLLTGSMSTTLSARTLACRMGGPEASTEGAYVDGHIGMALLGRGAMPAGLSWDRMLVVDHLQDEQLGLSMWQFLSLFDCETVLQMMDAGEAHAARTWGGGCGTCSPVGTKAVGRCRDALSSAVCSNLVQW